MNQRQQNARKMFANVLQFFAHAGAGLLGVKKIQQLVAQTTTDVAAVDAEAIKQPADTTELTRTRTETKKEAAEKAEALRGLALALSADDALLATLRKPVSKYLYSAEAGFLTYAQRVADGIATLDDKELKDADYAPAIRAGLVADQALHDTVGETAVLQKAGAVATDNLGPLFAAVEADLVQLDKFVHFQRFAQPDAVAQYEALRVQPKTPATRVFRAKGTTPYNEPQLAYNLLEEDVPTPTFPNTGGRGHEVVLYLGATASSHPRPGQGLPLKNGKKRRVEDYALLGDPATEPYVLVLQTSELAAGSWRVEG